MSVNSVNEMTGRDGSQDVDTNLRYRRVFVVRTDTPQDGASVVLAAVGINFNDPYQYIDDSNPEDPVAVVDNNAVAIDFQVTQDNKDDPCDWRIVVQYAGVSTPWAQPAEVEFSPTRYQKSLVVDLAGKPVQNSAGEPFESGIMVDRTRFTVTITKPVETWDAVAALAYQDSLNAAPFLTVQYPATLGVGAHNAGFPMQTCKLTWGAKRMRQQGTLNFYWLVTAVIDIDLNGWQPQVRDAGFNELIPVGNPLNPFSTPVRNPINGTGGLPIGTPWPLNGGLKVPPGTAPPAPLPFQGYNVMDWSTLGLEF